jgi:hypothetical protein
MQRPPHLQASFPARVSRDYRGLACSYYLRSLIHRRVTWYDAGYPREESGGRKPHARICGGESRMAELFDNRQPPTDPPAAWVSMLFSHEKEAMVDVFVSYKQEEREAGRPGGGYREGGSEAAPW